MSSLRRSSPRFAPLIRRNPKVGRETSEDSESSISRYIYSPDIIASIKVIGTSCGKTAEAHRFADSLGARIDQVTSVVLSTGRDSPTKSVFFLEWINPVMTCGHWMPELISRAGGKDVLGVHGENSKRVE